jgi:hypothetical protein
MDTSLRLTDILLEPVSNLMGSFVDGATLDASARRSEAKALLSTTRRLPTARISVRQVHGNLIEALRGSVGFEATANGNPHRRGVRPTEGFSELAFPA